MTRILLVLVAALSTANLLQLFLPPLNPTLGNFVVGYDYILQRITETRLPGWTEPLFEYVIRLAGFPAPASPHWKHVFVLMGIYFTSVARVVSSPHTFFNRDRYLKRLLVYPFNISAGAAIAFVCAVISGTLPIDTHFIREQALLPLITSLGLLAFDLLGTLWNCTGSGYHFWHFASRGFLIAVLRASGGFAIAALLLQLGLLSGTNSPAVASLTGLIFWLANYWLIMGAAYSGKLGNALQGFASWHVADGMVLGPGAGLRGHQMTTLGLQMYSVLIAPLSLWALGVLMQALSGAY
jgi:hypothetical protein